MKKVILISGKAQHGKTTVAHLIRKNLELEGQTTASTFFAKYIKQWMIDYYGWDGKDKSPYWRTKLQQIGTERARIELNMPHIHVARTCEDIMVVGNDFDYITIDDCRFRNEAYYTKAEFPNATIHIKVVRPKFATPLTIEQQMHVSETDMDNYNEYNEIILNSGTIAELEKKVEKLVAKIVANIY